MLREVSYKPLYRSFFDDFDKDFLVPSYKHSIFLDRASGYFSLKALALSVEGILQFIENNGHIRLICNPDLSEDDLSIIDLGYRLDAARITKDLIRSIDNCAKLSEREIENLDVICNMIAESRLTIKIAFLPTGIYHEKFGIFGDTDNEFVYFNGSANETPGAKIHNVESFAVFKSWEGNNYDLIQSESQYFNNLWEDNVPQVVVLSFPDAVKQHLFSNYKRSESLDKAIAKIKSSVSNSSGRELYDYQSEAIDAFCLNHFCHFYEMATGTGKTFTAIKTIERLREELNSPVFVIICVPQIDLQTQWRTDLESEGYNRVFMLGGESDGKFSDQEFDRAVIAYARKKESIVVSVALYDTFFSKYVSKIQSHNNVFLIFDEAHNLSPSQISKLPDEVKFRLGLSATIERFDQNETKRILSYFLPNGNAPFYFGIEEAIQRDFLSRYEFYPVIVHLTREEFEKYQRKTKAIATLLSEQDPDIEEVNKRRMERSLIVKQAKNKLDVLEELIEEGYGFQNSVVYCGAGKSEDDIAIIDKVTEILHRAGHYTVSQFTSKTPNRETVLAEFESGFFDTLVAIRCFDKGVDCPKLDKIYIMASETSIRQTVQRRGRVLRKCRETGKTLAYIYDMCVLPPSGVISESGVNSLIEGELMRAKEYARLAENKNDCYKIFKAIEQKYHINDSNYGPED